MADKAEQEMLAQEGLQEAVDKAVQEMLALKALQEAVDKAVQEMVKLEVEEVHEIAKAQGAQAQQRVLSLVSREI